MAGIEFPATEGGEGYHRLAAPCPLARDIAGVDGVLPDGQAGT
jgi:hypothetical protein